MSDHERWWPEPYIQPNPKQDCTFYAAAYIARCLGWPETTAQDVIDWRERENRYEHHFLIERDGVETRRWWDDRDDEDERRRWWLGPGGREWVQRWIRDGWIGYVHIHRIAEMSHAVVLLDATDEGALLMDPIYGHVVEPWDWFLGDGPGNHGAHHIQGWHRRSA